MIEIRYRVVNKWLKEIRDIDVQESSVKGNSGSFGVTTPLHCKVGEYLDMNLTFHDNTFQKSLNSGLLRTYLQKGDIVQVWYDTELKKEVDSPYGQPQPIPISQQDNQVIAMAKIFKEAGITANDLKDIVSAFKAKKEGIQNNETTEPKVEIKEQEEKPTVAKKIKKVKAKKIEQPVDKSQTPVDKSVDNSINKNEKNIEFSNETTKVDTNVDNTGLAVNNLKKEQFKSLGYQSKLKAIKECNNTAFLQWIQANFSQVAIFNAVNKRLEEIQEEDTPKTENK